MVEDRDWNVRATVLNTMCSLAFGNDASSGAVRGGSKCRCATRGSGGEVTEKVINLVSMCLDVNSVFGREDKEGSWHTCSQRL